MRSSALLFAALAAPAASKRAFVLLGSTGDNAYRPAGVWTGLYEAWCTGLFETSSSDLHIQINQGHTIDEIHTRVMDTLGPFYEGLKEDPSWKCSVQGGCDPESFFAIGTPNIWAGQGRYNATGQAANMSYLADYDEVISYMSIPPSAYGEWATAMVQYWGGPTKQHIAVEKPFGGGRDSLQNAKDLYNGITSSGLPASNLHFTDHWLSFHMNAHLPDFRKIVEKALGIEYSGKDIERIVVTEYEQRGFGGRGNFIDGLGQVRDMVQSHLLQVMALTVMESDVESIDKAKEEFFDSLSLDHCELQQFEGLLRSKRLKYHGDFADSTWCRVFVNSTMSAWKDVELVIQTGKSMDINLYSIDIYQRDGPGIITIDNGKEEVGTGDIKVKNWKLKDASKFEAPLPGFDATGTVSMTPDVDSDGNGYILRYNDPSLYFPKPYSKIVTALLTANYGVAFATWNEARRGWEIVTGSGPEVCLDPKPEDVPVYLPAFLCDLEAPEMCDTHQTVKDLYEKTYACTAEHDAWYADVDFYQKKCHATIV